MENDIKQMKNQAEIFQNALGQERNNNQRILEGIFYWNLLKYFANYVMYVSTVLDSRKNEAVIASYKIAQMD